MLQESLVNMVVDEIFARVHTFGKALASNGGKLQIGLLNSN
jgi:hypothetical protein